MISQFERRELYKKVARRVVDELWADLKAGKISVIGIDLIRARLRLQPECPTDRVFFDQLEELTTRRLVEKVG